jgi:hypothetical protein
MDHAVSLRLAAEARLGTNRALSVVLSRIPEDVAVFSAAAIP